MKNKIAKVFGRVKELASNVPLTVWALGAIVPGGYLILGAYIHWVEQQKKKNADFSVKKFIESLKKENGGIKHE